MKKQKKVQNNYFAFSFIYVWPFLLNILIFAIYQIFPSCVNRVLHCSLLTRRASVLTITDITIYLSVHNKSIIPHCCVF